jgi:hypothetical protein
MPMSKSEGSAADRPPVAEPEFIVVTLPGWRPSDGLISALVRLLREVARKRAANLAAGQPAGDNSGGGGC